MAVFERLVSSTLRGRVTEKIGEAILGGILKQGERIVERQLASEFATSLTVVREALIQLEVFACRSRTFACCWLVPQHGPPLIGARFGERSPTRKAGSFPK